MTENLKNVNKLTQQLQRRMKSKKPKPYSGEVFVGVDVGTANVVSIAVDKDGNPLGGVLTHAKVTREGMISDYIGAVKIVQTQIEELKRRLGCEITAAMSAYPPQTEAGNRKVTRNILEAADLNVIGLVNEPEAASLALALEEGVVVDVGGGTTGISVVEGGKVLYSVDEPTGGFQFDLVIAGRLGITVDEAERLKRDPAHQKELFPVVRPVMEKVSSIITRSVKNGTHGDIYLVGGTCAFPGFPELIRKETGIDAYLPKHPLLITPLGIALACKNKAASQGG